MKHLTTLAMALALAFAIPTGSYAQHKSTASSHKSTSTTQKTQLTPEQRLNAFYKKWGSKFELWCDGQATYGWPKQFFVDMAAAMPDRFVWEKVASEKGYVGYEFVFKRSDDPYSESVLEGTMVFQGSKLYAIDVQAWG